MSVTNLNILLSDGQLVQFSYDLLISVITRAAEGLEEHVSQTDLLEVAETVVNNIYDGISEKGLLEAITLACRERIERIPEFSYICARVEIDGIEREVFKRYGMVDYDHTTMWETGYSQLFKKYIEEGVEIKRLSPELLKYDLDKLGSCLHPHRNGLLDYIGAKTLLDRYLIRNKLTIIELPQWMFMRVAMGICILNTSDLKTVVEVYDMLSKTDYMSSTPTLFNAGTLRAQLSSCFLTTVPDDLQGIYGAISDNAMLSKWAGGLGMDWTPIRAMGSWIEGTNGTSSGVVPFLKVMDSTTVAVNQGGKRQGSACAYLETWHLDIQQFLDLRKNTGDDRFRTHNLNTANWVPDVFMMRVFSKQKWTLFTPNQVPELHELYGAEFEACYKYYEENAVKLGLQHKVVEAEDLWRKMLTAIYETGHPWITFKDACNLRSPQTHCGVVHSSNLCCIAADQRVVTDRGLLTVGELYALGGENIVLGKDGFEHATEMFLPRPNAEMGVIYTKEGYTHKVTPDHPVWVVDKGWTEAQDLMSGDKLLTQQLEGMWGTLHYPTEAYLIGLIIGDGTFHDETKPRIDLWAKNYHLAPKIKEMVRQVIGGGHVPDFKYTEYVDKMALTSTALGKVLAEKFGYNRSTKLKVPDFIWKSDRATVEAFLAGLYQTDGTLMYRKSVCVLALSSVSASLLSDVQLLLANMDVKASFTKMRDADIRAMPDGSGGSKDYPCQTMYRLMVTSFNSVAKLNEFIKMESVRKSTDVNDFVLAVQSGTRGYDLPKHITFKEYIRIENEDAYCLTVHTEDHAWTVNGFITKNTEITLNTSADEIAVCNLGSINLSNHVTTDGKIDYSKLRKTVTVAIATLDKVIDVNYYSVSKTQTSNMRHRPIGLGIMGFQDMLYKLGISYSSDAATELAGKVQEFISYHAISASSDLALIYGQYKTFKGSTWSRGVMPHDTLAYMNANRQGVPPVTANETMDWDTLRKKVMRQGMRNSNVMAIAPTATIANICGVGQSIEPTFQNLYTKTNLSGDFTYANRYLVNELRKLNLWNDEMVDSLKASDGSVQNLANVPKYLKDIFATAFEVEPKWLIAAAAERQKWIDQAQSLNLYINAPNGKKLDIMYKQAWLAGVKTTYYLRALGATSTEKSTISTGSLNSVSATPSQPEIEEVAPYKACSIDNPDCESCQ